MWGTRLLVRNDPREIVENLGFGLRPLDSRWRLSPHLLAQRQGAQHSLLFGDQGLDALAS
jgi:hypothetical protein